MKRSILLASLALAMVSAQAAEHDVSELAWLGGCWHQQSGEAGEALEVWLPPQGGVMMGVNHAVQGGETVAHEFVQIRPVEDALAYVVQGPAGKAVSFALETLEDQEVVFANPEHDFPQRIIYVREGDTLKARIEGEADGETKVMHFPMQRVSCDGLHE